jgi:hypothetical protein
MEDLKHSPGFGTDKDFFQQLRLVPSHDDEVNFLIF